MSKGFCFGHLKIEIVEKVSVGAAFMRPDRIYSSGAINRAPTNELRIGPFQRSQFSNNQNKRGFGHSDFGNSDLFRPFDALRLLRAVLSGVKGRISRFGFRIFI